MPRAAQMSRGSAKTLGMRSSSGRLAGLSHGSSSLNWWKRPSCST